MRARSSWTRGALILAVALAVTGGLYVHRPDLLLVEQVEFSGHQRTTESALRHLADIRSGARMWQVAPLVVAQSVERHPWVRRAEARRVLPGKVVVHVEEYEPVALLLQEDLYYVDRSGHVFLRASSDDLDYPVLLGVDVSLEDRHPALPRAVIRDALALVAGLDAEGLVSAQQISHIRFSETRGFEVALRSGARLAFGLADHGVQRARLAQLLPEVDLTSRVLVDLAPSRVAIVRTLDEPGTEGGTLSREL